VKVVPDAVNTVPTVIAIGAAGGAGLVVVNNPDTALTVHI
jgi:hypothetical protein